MSFLDEVDSWSSRLHVHSTKIRALVGLTSLVLSLVMLMVLGLLQQCKSPSFVVNTEQQNSSLAEQEQGAEGNSLRSTQEKKFSIHVVGAVATPGVVEVNEGARVGEAIEAAGGVLSEGCADALNLARVCVDGEQIFVPTADEVNAQNALTEATSSSSGNAGMVGATTSSSSYLNGKLNINKATAAELEELPGIGAATAQKIIADREASGPFQSPEDLKRVSGIGDKKYASLADLICVG